MNSVVSEKVGSPKGKPQLGVRLRSLREARGYSLPELANRTGLSRSSLYKVENSGMSLTYDKLIDLAEGLEIEVSELFQSTQAPLNKGESITGVMARREVGRVGDGYNLKTKNYDYRYLCPDLLQKKLIPILGDIIARDINEFEEITGHVGEEFTYVIDGTIKVFTAHYAPVRLEVGDHIYLDSAMPHAFVSISDKPAKILTICTSPLEGDRENIVSFRSNGQP